MVYFISDVHLGFESRESDRAREDKLLSFLGMAGKDAKAIVIAGDLFDYWFEYKTVTPKYYYRTLARLGELRAAGIEIEYVMGNHDFGHLDFFEKELGIPVHKTDIEREWYGKKFYISHGDGKANNDLAYRIIKRVTRSPINLWLYRLLHPNIGIGLARGSSRKSREYTGKKDYGPTDGMLEFARKKIDAGFDFVVMGHKHRIEEHTYPGGKYFNIGEWIKHPVYLKFDGKSAELHPFP